MTIRICPRCNQEFTATPPQKQLCPTCSEKYDPASLKRIRENQRRIDANSKCPSCGSIKTPISKLCWQCYTNLPRDEKVKSILKNGLWRDSQGYTHIYKPDHPNATKQGYVLEHRFVMAEYLGRPLTKREIVHHFNAIKDDNRLCNLALVCHENHPTKTFMKLLQKHIRKLEAELAQRKFSL
uniref:Putative homing endonuclease n=1 Tax=viral metagenome TaxID=1070528 RepID=A0A6M3KIE1_9ZZZZ